MNYVIINYRNYLVFTKGKLGLNGTQLVIVSVKGMKMKGYKFYAWRL